MSDDEIMQECSAKSPREIYEFFRDMSVADLEQLAVNAIAAMVHAGTRGEAELGVIRFAPFFLDCTFPRLQKDLQDGLRATLDVAEVRFGSLSDVLGLNDEVTAGPSQWN